MGVLLKPKEGGRPIVVDKPIMLIGRHPDCDVIIKESPKISRKHCCLALVDNRFVVRDLDSMNGVWVNGDRVVHSSDVRPGDELTIGDVPFELVNNGARGAAPKKQAPESRPAPEDVTRRDAPGDEGVTADDPQDDPNRVIEFSAEEPLPFSSEGESGDDYVIPLADLDE